MLTGTKQKALLLLLILPQFSNGQTTPSSDTSSDQAELAKKLSNPVASLVSVPFQNNFQFGVGGNSGYTYILNIQQVVPLGLTGNWNLIVRPIIPLVHQDDIAARQSSGDVEEIIAPGGFYTGLGDITPQFYFSPSKPGPGGLIWGTGPVFLLPTATDRRVGSGKWGAGPTAVVLRQRGKLTAGILGNHIWSFAGHQDRRPVSQTFLQPFFNINLNTGTTLSPLVVEASYNWKTSYWTTQFVTGASQIVKLGGQLASVGFSVLTYPATPPGGPAWGIRFTTTLLFPQKH